MQVGLVKASPFAKCDTCTSTDEMRAIVVGEADNALLEQVKVRHLDYVKGCRKAMRARAEYARLHPDDWLYVNIDGMDQNKTNLPNPVVWGKSHEGRGKTLVTRLLGAIAYGWGYYGFWSLKGWGRPSNVTLTGLWHIIADVQRRSRASGAESPRKLLLQMDNCAKDNKNHLLIDYCGMLLAEKFFDEAEVHFLPVGHTHQEIDATFSLVSKKIRQLGALSLPELVEVANKGWGGGHQDVGCGWKQHIVLDHVKDFKAVLCHRGDGQERGGGAPNMEVFEGIGTEVCESPLLPLINRSAATESTKESLRKLRFKRCA